MSTRKPQGIMSLMVLTSSSVPKSSEPRVETQNAGNRVKYPFHLPVLLKNQSVP